MAKGSIQNIPIAIIGAGNLATNLAKALYKKGFRIIQVYSRTEGSAREIAEQVESVWTTNIGHITTDALLYITALTDTALIELVPQLVKDREHGLWIHTAGSIPMSVWGDYTSRYGVFYPMQTFSKQHEVDFSELSIFIESVSSSDTELLAAVART